MDLIQQSIVDRVSEVFNELDSLELEQKIEVINEIRKKLHDKSPFKDHPVDCVLWEKKETVIGNDYNPNSVAPPEMRLLELSIQSEGYTMPIVTGTEIESGLTRVVDGFHRHTVGKKPDISKKLHGYLPTSWVGAKPRETLMAATIRHNRARGKHGIEPMVDIVASMIAAGMRDEEVAKALGMDADELLRLKQNTGLPELFKNREYSKSWE